MNLIPITEQIKKLHQSEQTLIVGIDGLGGAGKTTISETLRQKLQEEGYLVTLLHMDDLIHPKSVRYHDAYPEWECYYNLQWRYSYFRDAVVSPVRAGKAESLDIELYDKENDTYFTQHTAIPAGSIVIVEGVFLQRKELQGIFDYMIYINIPEKIRLQRVLERDGYIGDASQIRAKYENRYFPAERHYVAEYAPDQTADHVITIEI